jgi:hypothetical protein
MKRLGMMLGGTIGLWFLVAVPVRAFGGSNVYIISGIAALLCLAPSMATLLWAGWAFSKSPDQQLVMVLGGTAVRLFFVLAGAVVLLNFVPFLQGKESFWLWLLFFYLTTLSLEMVLILTGKPGTQTQ